MIGSKYRSSMTERELLNKIRSMKADLPEMIATADFESKYDTKHRLMQVYLVLTDTEASLSWHVEGKIDGT
jgi:hypothetical protein